MLPHRLVSFKVAQADGALFCFLISYCTIKLQKKTRKLSPSNSCSALLNDNFFLQLPLPAVYGCTRQVLHLTFMNLFVNAQ